MFGNPSKEGYVLSADQGTSRKKMVANCLKLQTKARVKEKKEENVNKEKKLPTPNQQIYGTLKSKAGFKT